MSPILLRHLSNTARGGILSTAAEALPPGKGRTHDGIGRIRNTVPCECEKADEKANTATEKYAEIPFG